jgi:phenylacetate-CoA ligase
MAATDQRSDEAMPVTTATRPTLPQRLGWTLYLAAHLRGQARQPFQPLATIQRQQTHRLRRMVAHAQATVPYYRETLTRLGLGPDDFCTADDLAWLPVLERDDLQRDPLYYTSTAQPLDRYLHVRSGGSSGMPRSVYHDAAALFQNAAHGERERSILTAVLGRRGGYRETVIISAFSTAAEVQTFVREHALVPRRVAVERQYLSLFDSPADNVARLNEFQPDIIVSYGSYFGLLYGYLAASGATCHRPALITYNSDGMAESVRRLISEQFGIPVFSTYQAIEAFKLGFECQRHTGLHLNLDLYPLRIVDGAGRTLPAGESGEVLMSNLVNRATVLLNYRLGDIGRLLPTSCACGRTLPLLSFPEGRNDDMIALPSGATLHPQAVRTIFTGETDVWQYQVVQHDGLAFDVAIIAGPPCDQAATRARVTAGFRRVFGEEVSVAIRFVDSIDRTAAGKFRPIVSLEQQTQRSLAAAGRKGDAL